MDPARTLAEPSLAELAEARERADAGIRLAMPEFAERLAIGAAPFTPDQIPADLDPLFALKAIDHLREARIEFREALKDADRMGDLTLHTELVDRSADLDDLLDVLTERWGS